MEDYEIGEEISSGLMTIREAAKMLNISKSTIERRIKAGDIRAIKLGFLTRISKNAVIAYGKSCPPAVYR